MDQKECSPRIQFIDDKETRQKKYKRRKNNFQSERMGDGGKKFTLEREARLKVKSCPIGKSKWQEI